MSEAVWIVNKGSGLVYQFNWPDGAGGNANLSGYTVDAYEPATEIASFLAITLVTPAVGLIQVQVSWDASLAADDLDLTFRVRINPPSGQPQTTNLQRVVYE